MGKHQSQVGDESLHPDLQEFVDEIGLVTGRIRIIVHEGKVKIVSVKPNFRFVFDDHGVTQPHAQIEALRLIGSITLVQRRLASPILDRVGRFGHIKVKVSESRVFEWRFTRRCKTPKSAKLNRKICGSKKRTKQPK